MATETARLEPSSDLQITAGYWVGALPCSPPGKKQPETHKPERNTSNRQKHQRPTRRATATSRQNRARQKFLESGPTSLPRGSWNEMPAATGKCELHQTPSLDTLRVTAGSWVGAHAPSVVDPHRKETKPERPTPTPGASRPRPKATATSRQPEQPKVNFGGPTLERNDVGEGSGCSNSTLLWKHAISYTVHWTTHHDVQDPSAGHKKWWLADDVLEPVPQCCRPGGPAIADHQIYHNVFNDMSR